MIILYGTKVKSKEIGQTKEVCSCGHCNNTSIWTLYNNRRWFTLFFIPIFPLSSTKFLECPVCGWGIKVDNKNSDLIMPLVAVSYTHLTLPTKLEV